MGVDGKVMFGAYSGSVLARREAEGRKLEAVQGRIGRKLLGKQYGGRGCSTR